MVDNTAVQNYKAGYIQTLDSLGKTQSEAELFVDKTSTYLLPQNTRYIDILPGVKQQSSFKVTVISWFPIDDNQRESKYQIAATEQSSRIDLTGFKTSGLVPMAVKVTQVFC